MALTAAVDAPMMSFFHYLGPPYAAVLREAHDDLALTFTPDPSCDSDCTRLSLSPAFRFLLSLGSPPEIQKFLVFAFQS